MTVTHVLVATDGSDNAGVAVRWAGELAAQAGAPLTVMHVFEPLAHLDVPPPIDFAELKAAAAATLDSEWSAPARAAGADVATEVVNGKPADAISDAAARLGADLVVVGARGLGSLKAVVLGSVSQRLPHICGCPVTIIPL